MSYLGKEIQYTSFEKDTFSGDGVENNFTLSHSPASASGLMVSISGVYQIPDDAYTVDSNIISFTGSVPTGVNNVSVVHLGVAVEIPQPAAGSATNSVLGTDSVTQDKMNTDSVGTDELIDNNVTPEKMQSGEIPFAKSYTSTEQTITSAGQLVLPHSLTTIPILIQSRLICKTAEGDYSIGDEVIINSSLNAELGNKGLSLIVDNTNLTIRYGSDANAFQIIHATTGVLFSITNASWKLVLRAWV